MRSPNLPHRVTPPFPTLPRPPRRAEYQRNKEAVISMLLQVVMNIENPYQKQ